MPVLLPNESGIQHIKRAFPRQAPDGIMEKNQKMPVSL
jgi:hypothetical protein